MAVVRIGKNLTTEFISNLRQLLALRAGEHWHFRRTGANGKLENGGRKSVR